MIAHEIGKCYRMKFSDDTEINFRYIGVAPVEWGPNNIPTGGGFPVVEIGGEQHNLHQLMVGRTIHQQSEIDCSEL